MDKWLEAEHGNLIGDDADVVTIYLVRHGSTELNEEHKLRGWADVPLSEEGLKQAAQVGKFFDNVEVDVIACSDLARARQTAEPIGEATGAPVYPTQDLRTMNIGKLQGQPIDKYEPELETMQERWQSDPDAAWPGGESFSDFQDRNCKVFEQVVNALQPGWAAAIVAHNRNCVLFLAMAVNGGPLTGDDLELLDRVTQDVAGISVLKYNKKTKAIQIHKQNYTEHLVEKNEEGIKPESWFAPAMERIARIVKRKDGYHVLSEEGKNLGGPYKSRGEAEKRLQQVEYFKHKGGLEVEAAKGPVLVGTSGFKYKHWFGTFYPQNLPGRRCLEYYSTKFPTVEVSATFHSMPEPRVLANWRDAVPAGFVFALRGPKAITHDQHLLQAGPIMDAFCRRAEVLGDKLGPITFQLMESEHFDPNALEAFVMSLPHGFKYSMEFRSEPWHNDDCYAILNKRDIASVIVSHSNMGIHTVPTASWSHVRLSGHHPDYQQNTYSKEQLMNWRGIIADARKPAYVYFNNEFKAFAADNAATLMNLVGLKWGPAKEKTKTYDGPEPRRIAPDVALPNQDDTDDLDVVKDRFRDKSPREPNPNNYLDQYPGDDTDK